jgi:hypothetical protein
MKAKSFAVLGVVILIIIGALALQAGGRLPFLDQWLGNLNPFKPQPTTITFGDAVIDDIKQVSELTTVIYSIQEVHETGYKKSDDPNKYDCISTGGDFGTIMVVKGMVEAGLDLTQLDASDVSVSEDGKSITVNLPPVKILTERKSILSSNPKDTYVYLTCGTFSATRINMYYNPIEEEKELRATAGGKLLETACNDGILKEATDDARVTMEKFLKTVGPNVTVTVQTAPVPTVEECKAMG